MSPRRLIVLVTLVALGSLVAGCAQNSSGPGAGQTPARVPVSMTRTGGIAGVNQSIEVAVDGTWTYTDKKKNTTEKGTLSAAQVALLQQQVADPGFSDQLSKRSGDVCADSFHYTISLGGETTAFEDCGSIARPAVTAAIAALTEATPF